ncbi:cytochrome c5 family protein [Venatoribacter cucullus]|uniref:Cytochrome c5 family protein n=1 Tax=Venatoribacter cucullus TaxID=2661630 RepID=A0A9X7UX64_9GAMM|nr:c-type cytochrome [Venatoribacter cucullus]QQD22620.1 cytochrome c5 family protein [Oceanospirillaceae bacterium ASx5O]QQD25247.1 cytochrome c5 family protein [Venatoribacter cucullus]
MKQLKALILAAATLVAAQAWAADDAQADKIRDRIKPVGTVCVGADCGGAAVTAAAEPRSGEQVYNTACMACHAVGVLDAPKKGDKAAWDDKLAKGLDASLQNAIKGINAMPPKGNCLNCSDDELLAAIKFMSGR